jgi:arylsulfatase A-like enzyme
VPEGLGLDRFGHGWKSDARDEEDEACAVITQPEAHLTFFSADADLAALVLELGLAPDAPGQRRGVRILLNGRRLGRLKLDPDWATRRLEVPAGLVRIGENVLTLRPGVGPAAMKGRKRPSVRLRQARFVSRKEHPPWRGRPDRIRVQPGPNGSANGSAVEMPTGSFLDLFVRLPEGASLTGDVGLQPTPGVSPFMVDVSVELWRAGQTEKGLFHHSFESPSAPARRMAVGLKPWGGQIVRLRFRAGGSGAGIVRWQGVCVRGDTPVTDPAPAPPIPRVEVAASQDLGRPDVFMILLDAARADAFSPTGGSYQTPAAERLAAEGTVFRQAVAPAPWTGQSIPAIFTGLFPDTLRIGPWGSVLSERVSTLAQMMADADYRTVLWSQHPVYEQQPSLARGFEATHRASRTADYGELPAARDLVPDGRPTFAFVHLIPPHQPYSPPAPFRGAYSNWYEGEMSVAGADLGRLDPPTREERQYAFDRYLENAAYADSLLDRVLTLLDEQGRYRNAVVVLLSDHGEAFYEHGLFLHAKDVHREALHVPLIIKWPASIRGARPVVADPVSLIDLVPTLVDGLSLEGAPGGYQGRSLLPLAFGRPDGERAIYAMTRGQVQPWQEPRPQLMLEWSGWRVLHRPLQDETALYRVDSDPLETIDLARDRPLRTLLLRQWALAQWAANREILGTEAPRVEELDAEEREQLEALGYVN